MKVAWVSFALAMLLGCGAAAPRSAQPQAPASAPMGMPMAAPAPREQRLASNDAPSGRGGGAAPPAAPRVVADAPHSVTMLIYTAQLSLAVFHVEQGLDAVERIGRDAGGYLSTRQDNAVTIRVPRDGFEEAIRRIEALGDVLHRDIRAQDVTDEYVDLEARLKNAYAMRGRLQELLAKAAVKEALEIETQLGRVTEEIERLEGKLKLLRGQIAFSTITATFAPVADQPVRDAALLPFPWLQTLGLSTLLDVHP